MTMILPLDTKPNKVGGLYSASHDDFGYLYNPKGYGGVVVLDIKSYNIIQSLDGTKTLKEIADENEISLEDLSEGVCSLSDLGILCGGKPSALNYSPKVDAWIHTTNSCNLACSYCYIHKCKGDMSLETAKATVDKLIEYAKKINSKTIYLRFAGGEPLLRIPFLEEVINYSNSVKGDINIEYIIISNGVLVNNAVIEFIKKHNIKLGISLDGIGKYNSNRSYPDGRNSYDEVINSLELLLKNDIKPRILITVCPANLEGLPSLTKLLIDKELSFRFSLERNMDTGHPEILDKIEDTISTLASCISFMKTETQKGNFKFSFQLGDVIFTHPKRRGCGIGTHSIAVSHTGDVGTCGMDLASTFANIHKDDAFEALHETYSDLLNVKAYNIQGCNDCIWKYSCASACPKQNFATYGRYDVVSPYCEIYKALIPEVLDLYAYQIWQKSMDS